ncbi:MAG: hypothetical protein ACR650_09455 [Methylocystis sp.]|jgi:hypothetical protein
MLSSRLRVLLLAVAMVLQAIAGATGAVRAMAGESELGYEHCRNAAKAATSDTRPDGQGHKCESCCLCSGPPSVSLFDCAATPDGPRAFHVLGQESVDVAGAPPRLTRAGLARGPPGA